MGIGDLGVTEWYNNNPKPYNPNPNQNNNKNKNKIQYKKQNHENKIRRNTKYAISYNIYML